MNWLVLILFALIIALPAQAKATPPQLTLIRNGNIVLYDVNSATERILHEATNVDFHSITWSPDGSLLVFHEIGSSSLNILSNGETTRRELTFNTTESINLIDLKVSPDNQWIAYNLHMIANERDVYHFYSAPLNIVEPPRLLHDTLITDYRWLGNQLLYEDTLFDPSGNTTNNLSIPARGGDWSVDSTLIAFHTRIQLGENEELLLHHLETGITQTLTSAREIISQRFSPDGRFLAFHHRTAFWGDRINLIDLDTGEETHDVIALEYGEISAWSWSPDSTMIAHIVFTEQGNTLHITAIEERENPVFTTQVDRFYGWSPDSQWIAYQVDNDLEIVNLKNGTSHQIDDVGFVIGWKLGT